MSDAAFLRCIQPTCAATYDLAQPAYTCAACGALLDVAYDWDRLPTPGDLAFFADRWQRRNRPIDHSGVWRFRELLPIAEDDQLVTLGEGQTILQSVVPSRAGVDLTGGRLYFQYEGLNPSGSFKDNGMAAAFTLARRLARPTVACASTGNTSASLALFAAQTALADGRPMRAVVFIGKGRIAYGKLAQALEHGALTLQIAGDFDACMARIREAADRLGLYVMNSINPLRLEGQKTIMYRVLEGLAWEVPDWIVVPGGNLGNTGAFGKAFAELRELGLVPRLPQLAVVNAAGANTLNELVTHRGLKWNRGHWEQAAVDQYDGEMKAAGRTAKTVASAIEIARPVNLPKALRSLEIMDGVVCDVTDQEILDAKAAIGRCGLGCEPASAASLAGLRQLVERGVIDKASRVVCILTGHPLKDADATVAYHAGVRSVPADADPAIRGRCPNAPIAVANDLDAICEVLSKYTESDGSNTGI